VATDSTGYESGHTSEYYGRRCGRRKRRFPKLSAACDTASHLFTAGVADSGPHPDDVEFPELIRLAFAVQPFDQVVADAGYDAEKHHALIREELGAHSVIPPRRGRPTQRRPTGKYRREMAENFPKKSYGQRWQIESAFSQDKRRFGSALSSTTYQGRCRQLRLRLLVHNIALIKRALRTVFNGAGHSTFPLTRLGRARSLLLM
jgi:transposase